MIKIKLENEFTFFADSVNENNDIASKRHTMTIRVPFDGNDTGAIEQNLTCANIASIAVSEDDKPIKIFLGFSKVANINTVISKQEKMMTIQILK